MQYWGFYVKQHPWVKFNILGSAPWVLSHSKKAIGLHSLSFNLVIHFSTFDVWQTGGLVVLALVTAPWIQLLPVGGQPSVRRSLHSGEVMSLIVTLISSIPPSQASCKREPHSVTAPFFISSQIVWWWYIPKKESRECGGGEEKVPVLTATLMASIWVFWWKAPLNPSTQTTVNSLLLPWHNHSSVLPFLTISFSPWGYNWWPADSAEANRLVTLDWPASK